MVAKAILPVLLLVIGKVAADCYMHNPRGSNDRLDDNNRDRDNGNRVFDSQNNNRGGNNVGNMYYYAGSVMPMEFTVQHTCANPNNECEIIIQAMCDPKLRDGTISNTIPITPINCKNWDCDSDVRYGRHESLASYTACMNTERNKGLFTANQQLQGNSAIYTRQNPNGDRHGLECPEERDYYPYWNPSQWADIAVLTNQPKRCAAYLAASANTNPRWSCVPPAGWVQMKVQQGATGFIPISQAKCQSITYTDPTDNVTRSAQWTMTPPNGWPAPVCRENQWLRDNHNGNAEGGFFSQFNFTFPQAMIADNCAMRIRYNISTGDLGPTTDSANWFSETSVQSSAYTNSSLNVPAGNTANTPCLADVWSKYGLTMADNAASFNPNTNANTATLVTSREYVWKDNPSVDIFGSLIPAAPAGFYKTRLAVDTTQFGRTFQDRSHRMAVKALPSQLRGATIYNVGVAGKRGNNQQVYPATEYMFQPERLMVRRGDYIHFQWTGSNTNPNNNAGNGQQGTDRSNVVVLSKGVYNKEGETQTNPPTIGAFGRSYPGRVDATTGFLGFSSALQAKLALQTYGGSDVGTYSGEIKQLDGAGPYFDLGPQQATQNGIYHYICTRNHDFTNRDQKGTIVVSDSNAVTNALGWAGGTVANADGVSLTATQGQLALLTFITLETFPSTSSSSISNAASDFVSVQPMQLNTAQGQSLTLSIPYQRNAVGAATLYYSTSQNGAYSEYDSVSFSGGVATAQITQGGWYVVQTQTNWAGVVGITLAVVIVIAVGAYFLWRHMKNKGLAATSTGISRRV